LLSKEKKKVVTEGERYLQIQPQQCEQTATPLALLCHDAYDFGDASFRRHVRFLRLLCTSG
jgi:hypothetical protein